MCLGTFGVKLTVGQRHLIQVRVCQIGETLLKILNFLTQFINILSIYVPSFFCYFRFLVPLFLLYRLLFNIFFQFLLSRFNIRSLPNQMCFFFPSKDLSNAPLLFRSMWWATSSTVAFRNFIRPISLIWPFSTHSYRRVI